MRRTGFGVLVIMLLVAAIVSVAGARASSGTPEAVATPATPGAVREVINEGEPESAPGEELALVRYVIDPGAHLPAHTHPGMQVNVVVSGTLHYTVVEGTAYYTPAAEAGTSTVHELTSGQSIDFKPGDSFVEPEGMVHFGENLTSEPIVLLTASLFEEGEPPSTVAGATPDP
ncbi:MAG TPA: cupin domain-containing protein [Thermomicrobiales bacterium]|nr:cupin domain-containing protein [Thermomicrobiales bacterium]